jgi:hypothetical protein
MGNNGQRRVSNLGYSTVYVSTVIFIALVNHNTLNVSKTFQIVPTLMEKFCHRNKDKISQMEDMGNDATLLIGYHHKVSFEDICQIIQIMNYLFCYLTLLFINRMSLTKQKNQFK